MRGDSFTIKDIPGRDSLLLKMRVFFRKQLTYFWLMIRKINCFIFKKYLIWKLALVCQHLLFFAQKIKNSIFRTVDFSEFTNNYYKLDNKLSKRCLNKYIKYFIYQQFLISLIFIDMYLLSIIENDSFQISRRKPRYNSNRIQWYYTCVFQ